VGETANVLHVEIEVQLGGRQSKSSLELAFDVPPGTTVLFGPSGAGKSRTLAAITGIARPRRGRIAFGDAVWDDAHTFVPVHERRVALVFQSLALFPHMSALENVAFGVPKGASAKERIAAAEASLARMQVGHVADRRPRSLSGGEGQRVALARALAMRPRVLLLDEPFSALDAPLKEKLLAETRSFVDEARIPTLLVTHDRAEASLLGDRVLFLESGRITRRASAEEAFGGNVEGR
jgi:molybdate transport system ATP-binding protein